MKIDEINRLIKPVKNVDTYSRVLIVTVGNLFFSISEIILDNWNFISKNGIVKQKITIIEINSFIIIDFLRFFKFNFSFIKFFVIKLFDHLNNKYSPTTTSKNIDLLIPRLE